LDTSPERLALAAATNLAAWHDTSVRALGLAPRSTEGWWLCELPGPTVYHSAVQLLPATPIEGELADHVASSPFVSVGSPFDDRDLTPLQLTRRGEGLWATRAPGPLPRDDQPTWLRVEAVSTASRLAAFEQAMALAFDVPMHVPAFSIHAPPALQDPALSFFIARGADGTVAGTAMAMRTEVLGIYGVGTVPAWRRSGVASALTRACIAIAPELTAVLQPTPAAQGLYTRLGFRYRSPFSHWG
jgi:ribosomal protein S18 acetylase RimI-like enzyme